MTWKSGVSRPASRTSNHWAQQTKSPESECSSSTTRSPRLRFRDISFRAVCQLKQTPDKQIYFPRVDITDKKPRLSARYSSQPLRRSGDTNFCAASELGTLRFERSQLSFCPMRDATLPRSKVSVTSPENSKLPPGFTLLPLQASSHSRSFPGERGNVFGGCL